MLSPDVNILVSIYREDATHHRQCRHWLDKVLAAGRRIGVSELVLSGLLRVVTHPKIFDPPSPSSHAMSFIDALLARDGVSTLRPGGGHWRIFHGLCEQTQVHGNQVPDAYHAALAIEHGCEWITLDRGFGIYPGLRWNRV